jgi:hypothetical protein
MSRSVAITGDQLSNTLHVLGVNFLLGGQSEDAPLHKRPAQLLAALAESDEARLRLSLIPLFLEHPEFAAHVCAVAAQLAPSARLTLQCYYSAALWIAQKYQRVHPLPDYFSGDLGFQPTRNPDENMRLLAQRHADLSGESVNWLGTYLHAAQVWQKGTAGLMVSH